VKKRILVLGAVLALVAALVIPTAALAGDTAVTGNPAATIDITVPGGFAMTPLTPGTTPTSSGKTITVSANKIGWLVTATDDNVAVTNGKMTAYSVGDALYDPTTPAKLASVMGVIGVSATGATGATVALPTGGAILTGTAAVSGQAYTVTFSQPVSYLDVVLTGDGITPTVTGEEPDTYRIVVTFTGSTP